MFAKSSLAATLVAALVSALAIPTAHAFFPNRPITMVVPLPAGGTADLLCRLAGDKAGNLLGPAAYYVDTQGQGWTRLTVTP